MEHKCSQNDNNVLIYSEIDVNEKYWKTKWYIKFQDIYEINYCPFCGMPLYVPEAIYTTSVMDENDILFVEENALDLLLNKEILYHNSTKLENGEWAISLFVNCGDVFYWACADGELIDFTDIQGLYEYCFDKEGNYNKWGSTIWICMKRGMRPQKPIMQAMKRDGTWTDELENLPERDI